MARGDTEKEDDRLTERQKKRRMEKEIEGVEESVDEEDGRDEETEKSKVNGTEFEKTLWSRSISLYWLI